MPSAPHRATAAAVLLCALWVCEGAKKGGGAKKKAAEFRLTSPGFVHGGEFPSDNRGDEDDVNPRLAWSGAPKNTESFALIVDSEARSGGDGADAASRQTHWLVYDIPKELGEIRDELSGSGASDVGRLGMKEDAGQARHPLELWFWYW